MATHRLPRRRGRDHLGRDADPPGGRRAGRARDPVRLARRDVADQLPAARPRGDGQREAAGHRRAGRVGAGARGVRRDPGVRLGGGVRGGARTRDELRRTTVDGARRAARRPSVRRRGAPRPRRRAGDRLGRPPSAGGGLAVAPRRAPIPAPRPPRRERRARPRSPPPARRSGRHRPAAAAVARPSAPRPGRASSSGSSCWSLAVVVAGVAAYLFLPSAEITVTPQIEAVGPISLTVRADPDATAVDEAGGVIPAQTLEIPVEVSGDFPATGKRVETTAATGGVRWTNCDPSAAYTIPRGTIVRTASGDRVRPRRGRVPAGGDHLRQRRQRERQVPVQRGRRHRGRGGSGRQRRRRAPSASSRPATTGTSCAVNNPRPRPAARTRSSPGSPKKDVDAALASLADGPRGPVRDRSSRTRRASRPAPPCSRRPPCSASRRPPSDPQTLVDQEVETFTLGLTATGTVLAVDASPVEAIARRPCGRGHRPATSWSTGSTQVVVGDATVATGDRDVPGRGLREAAPAGGR